MAQALKDLLLLLYPPLVSRQMQFKRFPHDDHLVVVEEKEAKAIAKEVHALDEGTSGTILIEPLLDPLLLDPLLVVEADAIQEVPMHDDYLAIVKDEEAMAIVKEVQALDECMGCTILIEPLLDPLLLNPSSVVKLDAIQEVPIEDSSGTLSTCPVIFISPLARKQKNCAYGQYKRKTLTLTTASSSSSMLSS